jgi:hypothetical protein
MLGFRKTQAASLKELLTKKYESAAKLIHQTLKARGPDASLRLRLADVLQRSGRGAEAVPILLQLADELARAGSAAQAIAAFKRAQAIAPGKPQAEERLAELIAQPKTPTPGSRMPAPAAPRPAQSQSATPALDALEAGSQKPRATPVAHARADAQKHDASPPRGGPGAEAGFVEEVLALVDDLIAGRVHPESAQLTAIPAVNTPLFRDFTSEELVALIRGLKLRAFEPGEIIVTEGEPGESLFVLTTGSVRAYVRRADQHNTQVRVLSEGDFFGEVSLLEFEGRTATVTAMSRCELLEIDRATLDGISRTHPRIWDVIRRFYQERSGSAAELAARAGRRPQG